MGPRARALGAGFVFTILPPDSASGDFIDIVQRRRASFSLAVIHTPLSDVRPWLSTPGQRLRLPPRTTANLVLLVTTTLPETFRIVGNSGGAIRGMSRRGRNGWLRAQLDDSSGGVSKKAPALSI